MKYNTPILKFLCEAHSPTWKWAHDCTNPQLATNSGVWSRCRQCDNCLLFKQRQWISRSIEERYKWPRAWFCTFTYANPEEYDYANVQKALKRIRKNSGKRISYICTDEYDSRGERDFNPHHHLVVYGPENLVYRDIYPEWKHGNSEVELLKNVSASYVAKYITKTGCRIRASTGFGVHSIKHFNTLTMGR